MSHSPAFQFYPAEFLADENVVSMSLSARGAYITLICFCWREGSIPSDLNRLARLCGVDSSAMAQLWDEVCPCFATSITDASRLVHPRLEKEREKQILHRKERSETGKRGAQLRWQTPQVPTDQQVDNIVQVPKKRNSSAKAKPMANDGSSFSFSPSGNSGTNVPGADAPDISQIPKTSQDLKASLAYQYIEALAADVPDAPRYTPTKADWVQLEALWQRSRKAGGDGRPWEFTPDRVARALANYRASPIGKRTLAHFAAEFSTYYQHALNEFGKPVTTSNGQSHANSTNTSDPAQQHRAAQIKQFGRDAVRIGGEQPATGEA